MRVIREYPRLTFIIFSVALVIFFFEEGLFFLLEQKIATVSPVLVFLLAGFFSSISITAPFGLALLITGVDAMHPIAASLIAALGALIADMTIFEVVRFSLHEELIKLSHARVFRSIYALFHHPSLKEKLREYLLWFLAALAIASPFPDEIGILLLGSTTRMRGRTFGLFCLSLNFVGYLAIIGATQAVG